MTCCIIAAHKRLKRVLRRPCKLYRQRCKTAHRALQEHSRLFAVFCACYLAVYPAMLYSLQGAGGHTSAQSASTDTRYHRHAGRCTGQHSCPIIIMYIRGGSGAPPVMDPCQTVQHTADHANPAASRCFPRQAACNLAPGQPGTLHPAGQSINGARRAARNH